MNISLTGKRKQYMITKLQNDIFSIEQLLITIPDKLSKEKIAELKNDLHFYKQFLKTISKSLFKTLKISKFIINQA